MKPKDFRGNHLPNVHGLNIEEYEKLVMSPTELKYFKTKNGFTEKYGQCGFCMKQCTTVKGLRQHKLNAHEGRGVSFREGKGSKVNNERVAKPDNKKAERKGVRHVL